MPPNGTTEMSFRTMDDDLNLNKNLVMNEGGMSKYNLEAMNKTIPIDNRRNTKKTPRFVTVSGRMKLL